MIGYFICFVVARADGHSGKWVMDPMCVDVDDNISLGRRSLHRFDSQRNDFSHYCYIRFVDKFAENVNYNTW